MLPCKTLVTKNKHSYNSIWKYYLVIYICMLNFMEIELNFHSYNTYRQICGKQIIWRDMPLQVLFCLLWYLKPISGILHSSFGTPYLVDWCDGNVRKKFLFYRSSVHRQRTLIKLLQISSLSSNLNDKFIILPFYLQNISIN